MSSIDDFIAQHFDELSRYARLLTGNIPDAEDLLAETLSAAAARWDKVSATDQPLLYVRRMVTNRNISNWRSWRRRHIIPVANVPDGPSHDTSEGSVNHIFIERELRKLAVKPRTAVVMRYFLGSSYAEIAQELKLSEPGARTCVHRALKSLRVSMSETEGQSEDPERLIVQCL